MTPGLAAAQNTTLDHAARLLANGRAAEALKLAESAAAERPRAAAARHLLGLCHQSLGDVPSAEAAFRAGRKLDAGHESLAIALVDVLAATGREKEAEAVLRGALGANRRSIALCVRLAALLTAGSKPADALAVLAKMATDSRPDHAVLAEQARAYKALGQMDKAGAANARAVSLFPESAVAHHNLAAHEGDGGQFAAAAEHAARAMAKGGNAPQTWLVYARALLGLRRLDEADRAFREAIARQPTYLDAHRELAQLIWMRTEDLRAATALLDARILDYPQTHELFALRATIIDYAGDVAGAYATLAQATRRNPEQASLHLTASQLASRLPGGAGQGLWHAERAVALLPGRDEAETALLAACLAHGDLVRASTLAAGLVARRPLDQRALAYQATAWRLLGDERYSALYDYAAFVRAWRMDVPDGWSTLESYLADLAPVLAGLHAFRTHPLDQSLRHGSQATHLLTSDNPVIRAFFQAVDGPIRQHLAALGTGADPLRSRNTGGYRFSGAWSVRLRPGGYHTDHIHPEGWLSSACYVALPPSLADEAATRAAWIKFGQPGIPTSPTLQAEHHVEPKPGKLVLFPSYMWHGTIPFTTEARRLSVAFDLVPA